MYAAPSSDGYARFRAPPAMPGGAGSVDDPQVSAASVRSMGPQSTASARGPVMGHGLRGYGDPVFFGGADVAAEDVVKSLQPVPSAGMRSGMGMGGGMGPGMGRREPAMRRPGSGGGQRRDAPSASGPPSSAPWNRYDGDAPGYGFPGLPHYGGGGHTQPSARGPSGPAPSAGMNGYLPPVKYRRPNELPDEFDDREVVSAPRDAGRGGYRVPVDFPEPAPLYAASTGGPRARAVAPYPPYHPQQSQPQQQLHHLQQSQPSPHQHPHHASSHEFASGRGGHAADRDWEQRERERFVTAARAAPYQQPQPQQHREWPRELEPHVDVGNSNNSSQTHARRIHRELQPPPQSAALASMALRPNGHDHSPGSRIVTPAAALHKVQRAGLAARRVMPASPPRASAMMQQQHISSAQDPYGSALEPAPLPVSRKRKAPPPAPTSMMMHPPQHQQQPHPPRPELVMDRAPSSRMQQQQQFGAMPTASSMAATQRRDAAALDAMHEDVDADDYDDDEPEERRPAPRRGATATKPKKRGLPRSSASTPSTTAGTPSTEPKRRCGRKSMNYSSEQKRERNRAAVKKCRQRQALKYEYLKRKAEVLASENRALSEMLVKNVELDEEKRNSLTRGIQMDILLKIKEIFTQSLPKDFVLDADSIWDLNSVLAVSMPSRCYYGIESIKDFWRTSLRMRNKGKIRSFWAWLFRLPPGDRFSEFTIEPFSPTSNLYFINWTTKSTPPLSGSIVIMFGHGHRVTLHVEIFGWLIWRYLLTNTPFPEPPLE